MITYLKKHSAQPQHSYSLRYVSITLACLALLSPPSTARADNQVTDILPVVTHAQNGSTETLKDETDTPLRLTPDKSEIITLNKEAGSIIIGNPSHANVIADSSKKLVVIPGIPGATYITILDKSGQVLMARHVIVASPKEDYVRIKRVCTEGSDTCQNTSVFYCPDMCHEIGLPQAGNGSDSQSSTTGSDVAAGNGSTNNANESPSETEGTE